MVIELGPRIDAAIDRALEAHAAGGLVVVSSLAEGADRIVVHACLRRQGAVLHAVLPLPVDEYRKDFVTESSRREFDDLLAVAASVEFAETVPSRQEAYERAGYMMVARSDLVLAVWDGLPARGRGGTADIVDYARAHGVPVVRINGRIAQR